MKCTAGAAMFAAALLVTGAPAASASVSAAVPANAEACPRPQPTVDPICVFDGSDFTGLLENNPVWTPALPAGKNDRISSIINDSDYRLRVFEDNNYQGAWIEIGPHQSWVASAEWDNRISGYFMY
ncbi:peptidase inhibitor family I36 protein [Streptomyces griseoviridis]|uniref:peptidase inhibitor family I36 protein n=1 Tax=Streptomyces griseoviridis TaxID=45398 RepID=UPI0016798DF8|nr:peptidase inhibitor family I36 protein [Streptomyces niveoruber]